MTERRAHAVLTYLEALRRTLTHEEILLWAEAKVALMSRADRLLICQLGEDGLLW